VNDEDLERKERLADDIIKELCVHTAIEGKVLYPLAERFLHDGPKLVKEHLEFAHFLCIPIPFLMDLPPLSFNSAANTYRLSVR
jgi:hypothetical protein